MKKSALSTKPRCATAFNISLSIWLLACLSITQTVARMQIPAVRHARLFPWRLAARSRLHSPCSLIRSTSCNTEPFYKDIPDRCYNYFHLEGPSGSAAPSSAHRFYLLSQAKNAAQLAIPEVAESLSSGDWQREWELSIAQFRLGV